MLLRTSSQNNKTKRKQPKNPIHIGRRTLRQRSRSITRYTEEVNSAQTEDVGNF